jgi:hypothetical protein
VQSRRAIGGPGSAQGLEVAGEALDIGAARPEHRHPVFGAPGHVLAQIEHVGLAGEAAVTSQEPRQRQLLVGAERLVSGREQGACREGNVHGGTSKRHAEAPVAGTGQAAPATIRGRRRYVWPARSLQSEACLCQEEFSRARRGSPWAGGVASLLGPGVACQKSRLRGARPVTLDYESSLLNLPGFHAGSVVCVSPSWSEVF